ncbi:MAG: type II toxin-antitoxin system VapC family toxin [Actinomycetota bacterium]|nr:type II toxin-antitoxin system VapC family toxin [Actinomycetota bacterium]
MTASPLGVLDTSTVILLRRLSATHLPVESVISAVTLAELSVGPLVSSTDEDRIVRQSHLQQAEADSEPLPFDAAAARAFGRVAATLRSSGRKPSARAFDALIAATAISNGLPLYTCNPADFAGIPELNLVPVPHPDHPRG